MTPVSVLGIAPVLLFISITSLTHALCPSHQRHALLQLKRGFQLEAHQLQAWNANTDCCTWDGVSCDPQTGLVTALDLADRSISGELKPALFDLTSLQYLNLAYNYFLNVLPKTGFERLEKLSYLNLSTAGLTGDVPVGISLLTNLISLDLSSDFSSEFYAINSFVLDGSLLQNMLNNITNLQFLYLDYVEVSANGSQWGKAVSQVGHTLEELSLVNCSLTGPIDSSIAQLKV